MLQSVQKKLPSILKELLRKWSSLLPSTDMAVKKKFQSEQKLFVQILFTFMTNTIKLFTAVINSLPR